MFRLLELLVKTKEHLIWRFPTMVLVWRTKEILKDSSVLAENAEIEWPLCCTMGWWLGFCTSFAFQQ